MGRVDLKSVYTSLTLAYPHRAVIDALSPTPRRDPQINVRLRYRRVAVAYTQKHERTYRAARGTRPSLTETRRTVNETDDVRIADVKTAIVGRSQLSR